MPAKEIFKGHVVTGTLHNIYIRYIIDDLQQKILEHSYGTFCRTAIVQAIFVYKFAMDK